MKLRCLHDGILFAFLQSTNAKGYFVEKTNWGFELAAPTDAQRAGNNVFNRTLQEGRWARVLTIGPECKTVEVGDYICVEPMMWTNSFTHDSVRIYKTDESKVMLISKEKPDTLV
jgi:hypothetical protein